VHIKGVVEGLVREPPPHDIIKFLTFLVADGNYYPNGYLFEVSCMRTTECACCTLAVSNLYDTALCAVVAHISGEAICLTAMCFSTIHECIDC
jgi:hypothetical protein